MYAKKIKFEDFNGNTHEQTFYFNLTQSELMEMQMSVNGGFTEYVQRIIESEDASTLSKLFRDLILASYGEKSDDGMSFIKVDPVRGRLADAFAQTAAFSELYVELATNEESASEFVNGVIPAKVREQVAAADGHAYPPQIAQKA